MSSHPFTFPNPVDENSARLVAAGVVAQCLLFLATRQTWLLVPLAFGFVARVLAGPRFSPLGLFVTRFATPRLGRTPRLVPGPPKRFAQGIGAVLSVGAAVAAFAFATPGVALALVAAITVAASLEAFLGFCIGCRLFALLMSVGVIPTSVCEACNDLSLRRGGQAAPTA